ncbi:MAG: hypothetical protein BWY52_02641 [Chloroflexi bacterium ADurb.Bin325]|nr:MAG: hypothetical protein BWY52_02641 [Chloroflexi bacterium ADurb.Bin325]
MVYPFHFQIAPGFAFVGFVGLQGQRGLTGGEMSCQPSMRVSKIARRDGILMAQHQLAHFLMIEPAAMSIGSNVALGRDPVEQGCGVLLQRRGQNLLVELARDRGQQGRAPLRFIGRPLQEALHSLMADVGQRLAGLRVGAGQQLDQHRQAARVQVDLPDKGLIGDLTVAQVLSGFIGGERFQGDVRDHPDQFGPVLLQGVAAADDEEDRSGKVAIFTVEQVQQPGGKRARGALEDVEHDDQAF